MLEAAGTKKRTCERCGVRRERFLRREEVKYPPTGRAGERKESLDPCP